MKISLKLSLVAAVALSAGLVPAVAAAPAPRAGSAFTTPAQLSNPPTGGEPSIATDPFGNVFVVGPQGVPSGLGGTSGVGYWRSHNNGRKFDKGRTIGSFTGGGDSDVLYSRAGVLRNGGKGTIFVADLEATAAEICKSTNSGKSFQAVGPAKDPGHCNGIAIQGQAGPSNDRPWLTADPHGRVYLTYHEFFTAEPLAFRSDNGGKDDFSNACGPVVTNPGIEANIPQDVTGGTLVARPVTDRAGNLYVLFATTTQQENLAALLAGQASGTFSQLYLAVSHDHCKTFTDYTVFNGAKLGTNTVQFGDIFNDLAIDGAGNLYAVGAGYVGRKQPFPTKAYVYVLRSADHGKKWLGPVLVAGGNSAHMLPAAVGGPRAGQLAIGYDRTVNGVTNPNSLKGQWTYGTAETTDGVSSRPRFVFHDVNPGFIYHHGQICNAGILCGAPGQPSDRSLLDFTSAALGSRNCPVFTFAGNPTGSPRKNSSKKTFNYVTRQLEGCF